jgi:hypothetical protein
LGSATTVAERKCPPTNAVASVVLTENDRPDRLRRADNRIFIDPALR